jgi:hypothetical protein
MSCPVDGEHLELPPRLGFQPQGLAPLRAIVSACGLFALNGRTLPSLCLHGGLADHSSQPNRQASTLYGRGRLNSMRRSQAALPFGPNSVTPRPSISMCPKAVRLATGTP